jgi:hypothetical protein
VNPKTQQEVSLANIPVTIKDGCCDPLEIHVHDGDTVTWSTSDPIQYQVNPPGKVFDSNASLTVPKNGSVTSGLVTGAPEPVGKPYGVAPPCIDSVAPDIVIDGSPPERGSASVVVPKKRATAKKIAAKKGVVKKAAVKKTAVKKAVPAKKAVVKKAAVKRTVAKKAPAKKTASKKAAKKAVKKAPAKKAAAKKKR